MRKTTALFSILFFLVISLALTTQLYSQGVTTSAINGLIVDDQNNALPSANVIAVHEPSGTTYGAASRNNGRYSIPGMRVGGPYTITVSYVGFEKQSKTNVYLNLGVATDVDFVLTTKGFQTEEVTVVGQKNAIFSSDRTGASTSIDLSNIQVLPTVSRRIGDLTRLSPFSTGSGSFAGQDNRLNNFTVDGSYFNNSFGLAGQPGDRTNVAPISLDAIEQVQVNIAPYDVRQGNFVGAGVNTVTRSGGNDFSGSVYYNWRNQGLAGTEAGNLKYSGKFKSNLVGVRLGGPIIPNKLFFFSSFEKDEDIRPGTTYTASLATQTAGGSITRVLASDLDALSNYLKTNFDYDTGPYQGYDHETPATRALFRLDFNLNDNNKISLRYTHLDSKTDVLLSNSSSLGLGSRRGTVNSLNFQNSNYQIFENIRSIVGE